MPVFMHGCYKMGEKGEILFAPVKQVDRGIMRTGVFDYETFADKISGSPVRIQKSSCLFDICIQYKGGIHISEDTEKVFQIKITNNLHSQQWLECRLYLPSEWTARPGKTMSINLNQRHGGSSVTKSAFAITPHGIQQGRYDILLEIKSAGRLSKMYLTLPLFVEGM